MHISENSRIWIYQSNKPFSAEEEASIQQQLDTFTGQWQAHGHQLAAKAEIRYGRFIILMIDETQAGATGCSIDKSVKLMKEIEQQFGVELFDRFHIAYRDGNQIFSCNREEFENLLTTGKITGNTIVFNNLIQTVADLKTRWEVPFKDSWHAQVFGNLLPV